MMATTLRERFLEEMIVRGLSERTQKSYLLNVELMVRRTGRHPSHLDADGLREYFSSLVTEYQIAPSTFRQHLSAANLFFRSVLGREEQFFVEARPKKRETLPTILSLGEIRAVLAALRVKRIRTAATVAYCCGLRCSELLSLSVEWINSDSHSLHVRDGKGGLDRIVPLPQRTLELLRHHWRRERPSGRLLFESPQRRAHPGARLSPDAVRKALQAAADEAGIVRKVRLHTLRHCYASHLLERGVALPLIQRWLGHKNVRTTLIYAHVTPYSVERGRAVLAELTESL